MVSKGKRKMSIIYDTSSNTGPEFLIDTEAGWFHTLGGDGQMFPGLIVGVSIFTTGVSVTNGSYFDRNLIFIRADTNGIYRSELWYLPGSKYETALNAVSLIFSASCTHCAAAASYCFMGGVGAHGGATGTGDPASKALTPLYNNSIVFSNMITQTFTGITNADNQNNVWDIPGEQGTQMGSDKGRLAVPASTTIQFNGIVAAEVWAQSSVELLSYQDNPPAIMGL